MKLRVTRKLFAAVMAALPLCTEAQTAGNFPDFTRHHHRFATGKTYEPRYEPTKHTNTASKTTAATGSRLIAYSEWTTVAPVDSIVYYYTGTRGGYLSNVFGYAHWQWNDDSAYTYPYNSSTSSYYPYPQGRKSINVFDANNNVVSTTSLVWDATTSAWSDYLKDSAVYDVLNHQTMYLQQNWSSGVWVNQFEFFNVYGGAYITEMKEVSWNTTTNTWDSAAFNTYTYDASNHLISSLHRSWDASAGSWRNASQYANTYDASGNCVSTLGQIWVTTSSTWVNSYQYSYSDFIGSFAQTEVYQAWDDVASAFVNMYKDSATYNSYSQPVSDLEQTWNSSASIWENSGSRSWYYETYTTSVQNISASNGKATIYPVPAINVLSLSVDWDAPQAFTVAITDMTGRVCSTWNVSECSHYNNSISVSNLAAGNYIVSMTGANGKVVQQLTVVK